MKNSPSFFRAIAAFLGLLLICLIPIACDDSDGDSTVVQDVGPEGGAITSGDGNLTLTIPPGALLAAQTIRIVLTSIVTTRDDATKEVTYTLEPDGLQFSSPVEVEYNLRGSPDDGGDITGFLSNLDLVSGDVVEPLGSQGVLLSTVTGTSIARGTLTHFSELRIKKNIKRADALQILIDGVPDSTQVGLVFEADVTINHGAGSQLGFGGVFYYDGSLLPVSFIGANQKNLGSFTASQQSRLNDIFPYLCSNVGTGTYFSTIILSSGSSFTGTIGSPANPVPVGLGANDRFISIEKQVTCVTAVPDAQTPTTGPVTGGTVAPTNTPTSDSPPIVATVAPTATTVATIPATPTVTTATGCARLGGLILIPQNSGCGFSGNLSPTLNGNTLVFSSFGANSNVIFIISGNSATSQSSNLNVFNQPGHDCVFRGCDSSNVSLACENNNGGSCSQGYLVQED